MKKTLRGGTKNREWASHRGTRTRACLYTVDWAVELERNSCSPGFSPGSTPISTPTVQYTCTTKCGTLKTLHLSLVFGYCTRLRCERPRHCADVQLSQRGWVSSIIRSGLKDKANHLPAERIFREFLASTNLFPHL